MKSNVFLAIAGATGIAAAAFSGGGCGGGGMDNGSGGTSSSTSSSHAATTAAVGTGAGGGSGGNHSFTTASDIPLGTPTPATLADATTPDFYSFTGKKGERMIIGATAQTGNTGFDPTITDTYVTLYLPDKTEWASNDDGWPNISFDSTLFTELPEDGTYFVTVEDCNSYQKAHPGFGCSKPDQITTFDYTLVVADVIEAKGSASAPTSVTYKVPTGQPAGNYGAVILGGDFAATGEKQVFSFTPPADTKVDAVAARARASFDVQSIGATDGDGSTSNVLVTVKDMSGAIIAQANQGNYTNGDDPNNNGLEVSVPITLGQAYTIEVSNTAGTFDPKSSYYFIQHFAGSFAYGQPEAEKAGMSTNDMPGMAEPLNPPSADTTKSSFFPDGNLSSATDVDWYSMKVPSGAKTVDLLCDAERAGSGLRGFTAEIFGDATGTMSVAKLGPEIDPAKEDLVKLGSTLPAGVTAATVKISATGQDGTNTGNYYHCSIFFNM